VKGVKARNAPVYTGAFLVGLLPEPARGCRTKGARQPLAAVGICCAANNRDELRGEWVIVSGGDSLKHVIAPSPYKRA